MLVITVAPNKKVYIGETIVITNVGTVRARLGIDAPEDIQVERDKVRQRRLEQEEPE